MSLANQLMKIKKMKKNSLFSEKITVTITESNPNYWNKKLFDEKRDGGNEGREETLICTHSLFQFYSFIFWLVFIQ